ncbi:unnamed protein product [Orchesella dallaii]|uniref:ABC transporter domain-containing protein n=1 Tax=Orchesella dallaii TaxID=48710 RepID=A0ABP1PK55_9HEXA
MVQVGINRDGYRVEMETFSSIEKLDEIESVDEVSTDRPIEFLNEAYDKSDDLNPDEEQPIITVRSANKSYKSIGSKDAPKVLNDFNMTVPKRAIYALLGSSGSGKTTALSCILGLRNLDEGEIKVFGTDPANVAGQNIGYMPQDLCLYEYLTVVETLQYFGQIYGMDPSTIDESIQFLVKLLNLEDVTNLASTLSGGQKRRASFAIALIHKPQLLILDEPTVGVDPVLRERIWSYLRSLTDTQNVTVIITTHYIEEARQSHMIGLMGNGKLLYENAPGTLLRQTGSRLLADAVLQVYQRFESEESTGFKSLEQGNNFKESESGRAVNSSQNHTSEQRTSAKMIFAKRDNPNLNGGPVSKTSCSGDGSVKTLLPTARRTIGSLLKRNFIQMTRNPYYLSFLLILPAIQVLAAVIAIGGHPRDTNLGIVNHELKLNESQLASKFLLSSCQDGFYSCRYLKLVPQNDARLHFFQSEEQAINAVKDSSIAAFIIFPGNFTTHMKDRIVFNNFAESETLEGSQIELRRDMTDTQVALRLTQVLMETLQKFTFNIVGSLDSDPRLGMLPIDFSGPIYGDPEISHQSFVAPGVIVAYATFFPMCITAMTLIGDINRGTMERTLVAGVSKSLILTGEFITQAIILTIQTGFMYLIIVTLSTIKMKGSYFLTVILAFENGILGITIGT